MENSSQDGAVNRHQSSRQSSRLRTRQACEPCRKRRRKCDGSLPCNQCRTYEYDCKYAPIRSNARGKSTNAASANAKLTPDDPRLFKDPSHAAEGRQSPLLRPSASAATWERIRQHFPNLVNRLHGLKRSLRDEPARVIPSAVGRLLTFQNVIFYSGIYFDLIDPVFHFLEKQKFIDECSKYLLLPPSTANGFEAVVAGVIVLGSFFSESPLSAESELLEHAKNTLDLNSVCAFGLPSLDHATGWLLRALYIRLTNPTLSSWFASCTTLHTLDVLKVYTGADFTSQQFNKGISNKSEVLTCASFVNTLFATEIGIKQSLRIEEPTIPSSNLDRMTGIVGQINANPGSTDRIDIFKAIRQCPSQNSVEALFRSDLTFHLFRNHVSRSRDGLSGVETQIIFSIFADAFRAAQYLLERRQPWWNIVSSSFQSLLVLLVMDSDESMQLLPENLMVLRSVRSTFPSCFTDEILRLSECLVYGRPELEDNQIQTLQNGVLKVNEQAENWQFAADVLKLTTTELSDILLDWNVSGRPFTTPPETQS